MLIEAYAIQGAPRMLRPGGALAVTVPKLGQWKACLNKTWCPTGPGIHRAQVVPPNFSIFRIQGQPTS